MPSRRIPALALAEDDADSQDVRDGCVGWVVVSRFVRKQYLRRNVSTAHAAIVLRGAAGSAGRPLSVVRRCCAFVDAARLQPGRARRVIDVRHS
jgi:hypothetical protein